MKAQSKRTAGLIAVAILTAGPARFGFGASQTGKGGSNPGASRVVLIGGLNAPVGTPGAQAPLTTQSADPVSLANTVAPISPVSPLQEDSAMRAAAPAASMSLPPGPGMQAAVPLPEAAGPKEDGAPAPDVKGIVDPAISMSGPSSEPSLAGAAHQGQVGFDGAKKRDPASGGSPIAPGAGGGASGGGISKGNPPAEEASPSENFSSFHPLRAKKLRHGLSLSGLVNRSLGADIVYDERVLDLNGGKGYFFVTLDRFMPRGSVRTRMMESGELASLSSALDRALLDDPKTPYAKLYKEFRDLINGKLVPKQGPEGGPGSQTGGLPAKPGAPAAGEAITEKSLPGIYSMTAGEFFYAEARIKKGGKFLYRYYRDGGITSLYEGNWKLEGKMFTATVADKLWGKGRIEMNFADLSLGDLKEGAQVPLSLFFPGTNWDKPEPVKVVKTDRPVFPPNAEKAPERGDRKGGAKTMGEAEGGAPAGDNASGKDQSPQDRFGMALYQIVMHVNAAERGPLDEQTLGELIQAMKLVASLSPEAIKELLKGGMTEDQMGPYLRHLALQMTGLSLELERILSARPEQTRTREALEAAESLRKNFAAYGPQVGPDPKHGFSRFHPEQVWMIERTGRIVLFGTLKAPHLASIRSEAAKGSGPRIFVSFFVHPPNTEPESEGAERPMSRGELEDLKAALKEYQRQNHDDPSGEFYDQMIGRIEAELSPAAPASNQGPAGPSTLRSALRSPGPAGAIDPRIERRWAEQLRKHLSQGGFKNVQVALFWDGPAGMAAPSNIVKVMIPLLESEQTATVSALYQMLQAASGKEEFSWLKGHVWEIAIGKVKRGKVETPGGAFRTKIPFPGKPVEKKRALEILAGLPARTLITTYNSPMKGVVPFEGALGVSPMDKSWAVRFLEVPGWRLYDRSASKNGRPSPQNLYLQYTEP